MIEELENKINILSVQNEKLKAENEYLRDRCKNEYEGFIAVVHELCDTAMELDKYKSRCEKANEYIKQHKKTISKNVSKLYGNKLKVGTFLNGVDELEKEFEWQLKKQIDIDKFAEEQGFLNYNPVKLMVEHFKNKLKELKEGK